MTWQVAPGEPTERKYQEKDSLRNKKDFFKSHFQV